MIDHPTQNGNTDSCLIPVSKIYQSYKRNKGLVKRTPMLKSNYLSEKYNANVFLKR